MTNFVITGFADEIDADFQTQLQGLNTLGIKFIEIRGVNEQNISQLSAGEIKEIKGQLDHYGIKVSSIGSPIGKIQIADDFTSHLEMVKRIIENAHTLNSTYVRIFSFFIPKDEHPAIYREEVLHRLGTILEATKGSGITILHENEKDIYGDIPERCLDLMEAFKGADFASVFDPANFIQCGSESFPKAFNLLKPYIKYVHIKDALTDGRTVPAGMGQGQIEKLLKNLKTEGYEGFLSLEPHLSNFTGLAELENTVLHEPLGKSGLESFALAHTCLQAILNRI
jgi:sugar phosphate isomerase/epimerase